jgi:acyl-coenzyme A synthetase/AMP-(fatty) acid ligase
MRAAPQSPAEGLRHWAAKSPDRIALSDDHAALTFAELDAHVASAGRVAADAFLQSGGAFLPVVVARTVESCIDVLACMCARVPFFLVDAKGSPDYVRDLIQRAGSPTRAVVASTAPDDVLPAEVTRVIGSGDGPADAPGVLGADDDPGLVVFTSGSTGAPKGVVLDWWTLEERWRIRDSYAPEDRSRYSAPLIPALDGLWGVQQLADVASGCSTRVLDVARMRPAALLASLQELGPSHVAMPSQLARVLGHLASTDEVALPTVDALAIGSEGFRYEFVHALHGLFRPDVVVLHHLASTEAGRILSNHFRLDSAPESGVVSVGRPVNPDNVRFRPVSDLDGALSEVLASGAIARGYLDDPEQTERRFVVDDDGRRWWCSGDLVSPLDDGGYQHRGRLDDIVKVRGKLASPSEVVSALMRIDGIRAAVVIPDEQDSNVRLVAHVEIVNGSDLTRDQVRSELTGSLPAHLVPSAVMRHATLPVNARGKVDRTALMAGPFEQW